MKSSIKKRLFLIFIIVLLISELVFFILSNLFLNDIVISANRILIKRVYNEYNPYFSLDTLDTNKIDDLTSQNDIGIVIFENGNLNACSSLFLCQENQTTLPTYITNIFPYVAENSFTSRIINLKLLNINQLVYVYKIGNDKYVIIDKALKSIQEVNQILNEFIGISGIFIFILGSIGILIISNKLTKPIIKISKYANDLADLKFDDELELKNQDELGYLAMNMNLIKERLDTALKELNKRNQTLIEDLEKEKELDEKRIKFFSTVSHEFKTPITIIQGYAEGMKHHIAKSPGELEDYCDIIIDESKKMGRFVTELLNLSLYESGNFILNKIDFDLVELIHDTANKFSESIHNKKINLKIEGIQICIVNADRYRIEQVVNNFFSNALKHVEIQGIIKITIDRDSENARISFYNNGEKIDEKELNNIWSLFYKLENNTNHIGTGIGLSIVKSIVELHNGNYGVQNKADGVEFFIELPLK